MSNFIINPYRFGAKNATFGTTGTQYNAGASGQTTGTSTLTGIAAGDLVIALVQRDNQSLITGVTCDGTAMANLKRNDSAISGFSMDVWGWKSDRAISSAAVTTTYSSNAQYMTVVSARWSGVSSATLLTSSCNSSGCSGKATTSTSRLAQSITTSERSLIIACGTCWDSPATHTAQSGWTKRLDGSGTPLTSIQFLHDRVSDAGTFGGGTAFATVAVAQEYLAMLVAFPLS